MKRDADKTDEEQDTQPRLTKSKVIINRLLEC